MNHTSRIIQYKVSTTTTPATDHPSHDMLWLPVRRAASESPLHPYHPEFAWRDWGITCVVAGPEVTERRLVSDGFHLTGRGVANLPNTAVSAKDVA